MDTLKFKIQLFEIFSSCEAPPLPPPPPVFCKSKDIVSLKLKSEVVETFVGDGKESREN